MKRGLSRRALLRALPPGLLSTIAAPAGRASTDEAIALRNDSRPTRCAEEDNVAVTLSGEGIRRFRIEARHPTYIRSIARDQTAPDFQDCAITGAADHRFDARTVTLWDGAGWELVGHAFERFWRPERVEVLAPGRREPGLHLLQLFRVEGDRRIEVLVLYPSDGYWRAKPLPPPPLDDSAYGSSFLVGPVTVDGRPLVRVERVEFLPGDVAFRLDFVAGGHATLRVTELNGDRLSLDAALDPPVDAVLPFAAFRSMFVSREVADVARVWWRDEHGGDGSTADILAFTGGPATAVHFGREVPSRHNTSAPDMVFDGFRR